MSTEKKFWVLTFIFICVFAYGIWNLFQPDAFPMSFVRGQAREAAPNVIIGPYPTDAELKLLSKNGVTEVISLMDPESAVEGPLVEEEKRLAANHGFRFQNFPIDFKDMKGEKSALAFEGAMQRIASRGQEKVYVHCYLGRHRVGMVEQALKKKNSGAF